MSEEKEKTKGTSRPSRRRQQQRERERATIQSSISSDLPVRAKLKTRHAFLWTRFDRAFSCPPNHSMPCSAIDLALATRTICSLTADRASKCHAFPLPVSRRLWLYGFVTLENPDNRLKMSIYPCLLSIPYRENYIPNHSNIA